MPNPIGAIGAIGSVVGGVAQGSAAKSAARSQERAAQQDLEFQRETRDMAIDRVQPWMNQQAHQAYLYELGLAPAPTVGGTPGQIEVIPGTPGRTGGGVPLWQSGADNRENALRMFMPGMALQMGLLDGGNQGVGGTPSQYRVGGQTFATLEEAQAWAQANPTGGQAYGGFRATPGYNFRVGQGNQSINALANVRGGLHSGRTLQDLATFNQNIASEEYGGFMNRLAGLSDQGLGAATLQNTAGQNAAAGVSNALGAQANARAAGAVGVGNAISGTMNNLGGVFGYMQGLQQPQTGGAVSRSPIPPPNPFFGRG